MIGDEKKRNKLLLAVEICRLYCMTGASTNNIADEIGMSKASVKRYVTVIRDRKKDILRLCPEYSEEDLDAMEEKVELFREVNIRSNKRVKSEVTFDSFADQIACIRSLMSAADSYISDDTKVMIKNLRINRELSYRIISEEMGVSLSQAYRIATDQDQKTTIGGGKK